MPMTLYLAPWGLLGGVSAPQLPPQPCPNPSPRLHAASPHGDAIQVF